MKKSTLTQFLIEVLYFFRANSRNTHFFEKYIIIKIEDRKILVLMSKLSPKLDEVNASYPYKYNSILWDFHVFQCISLIYQVIIHFFEKYIKIQVEDHKTFFLMNKLSPKLDEVNSNYPCKYNSIL